MTDSQDDTKQLNLRESPRTAGSLNNLQLFLLGRLQRLIDLKNTHDLGKINGGRLKKGVDKAIYATLCDCIDTKVGEQAKAILSQERQRN